MRSSWFVLALLIASLSTYVEAADDSGVIAASEGLSVRVSGRSIVAQGLSPRGAALLFGVSVERQGFRDAVRQWDRASSDDDGDGIVTFDLDREIPVRSIWAVIDLHGRDYAVITPEGNAIMQPIPSSALRRKGSSGDVDALELSGTVAYVVVQRGASAWGLNVDADGRNDDDRANTAVMRIDPTNLRTLAGNAPAPNVLVPGDLVMVIDPLRLEFFSTRLAP